MTSPVHQTKILCLVCGKPMNLVQLSTTATTILIGAEPCSCKGLPSVEIEAGKPLAKVYILDKYRKKPIHHVLK